MIPKIIWQTYESSYKELPKSAKHSAELWQKYNPSWEYQYVSAQDRLNFVEKHFDKEWFTLFTSLPQNMYKGVLFKYMAVYIYGGVATDLDAICRAPIESWLVPGYEMVVTYDEDETEYATWAFASVPKSQAIEDLLKTIKVNLTKYSTEELNSDVTYYGINIFGETPLTISVKKYAEKTYVHESLDASQNLLNGKGAKHLARTKNWEKEGYLEWYSPKNLNG